uniref:AMP-dependent synthetase/ligase domain-containing protein n=1 Tax=Aegilops tauschii subsp. strangulata TaxID=200361 RepID=A0A453Q1W5_AEGTS
KLPMAEQAATPAGIDPRSGFCAATRTFHNVCSSSAGALPPESLPVTAAAAAYAFSLLASPIALRSSTPPQALSSPTRPSSPPPRGRRLGRRALAPRGPRAPRRAHVHRHRRVPRQPGLNPRGVRAPGRPLQARRRVRRPRGRRQAARPRQVRRLRVRCAGESVLCRREGGSSAGRHAAPTPPVQRLRVHDGLALRIHGGHGRAHGALRQFDFGAALRVILRYRVTLLPAAPPVLVAMIKSKEARHGDLSSLLVIAVGGAPLGRDVAERFAAVFTNVQVVQVKHETPCRLQNTTESSMQAGQEEEG